ncbi:hypothetical protein LAV72_17720 [Lysinibacillus xylanilyticus]|uniref:hypothetical protein n=1 Tax=Lysinibacillus xylanilyticus TaxID=582475 RepID=UPI002B23F112|nr:hypothetical protein [Lysinibacillus xylanilyticus]MEB2301446.1 hypothetical protein [Lysinibacillus xylanilyticus]
MLFSISFMGKDSYTYDSSGHPLTMTYQDSTYYLTNYRRDVLALTNTNGDIVAEYTRYE